MPEINGNGLNEFTREMLIRERTAVTARLEAIERDARAWELESDGIPSSSFESEEALTSMLTSRLSDIDNALARLDGGTYGICAECGNAIPPRRLEVQPFATLCVPCQGQADKRGAKRRNYSAIA